MLVEHRHVHQIHVLALLNILQMPYALGQITLDFSRVYSSPESVQYCTLSNTSIMQRHDVD